MLLKEWGDRHLRADDDRPMVVEHICGNELVPVVTCAACGDEVRHEDLTAHPQAPRLDPVGAGGGLNDKAGEHPPGARPQAIPGTRPVRPRRRAGPGPEKAPGAGP
ncbi:hypothetical protein GCM10020256_66630 [Streptomyces thermocoprophilus]